MVLSHIEYTINAQNKFTMTYFKIFIYLFESVETFKQVNLKVELDTTISTYAIGTIILYAYEKQLLMNKSL